MKYKSYLIYAGIALALIIIIMAGRGFFSAESAADMILIAADSFTAIAFIYIGIGALVWVSSTGFFDIFGYAIKWGAHTLIPGLFKMEAQDFYEYKLERKDKRRGGLVEMLIVGVILFVIAGILVFAWYKVSGNL